MTILYTFCQHKQAMAMQRFDRARIGAFWTAAARLLLREGRQHEHISVEPLIANARAAFTSSDGARASFPSPLRSSLGAAVPAQPCNLDERQSHGVSTGSQSRPPLPPPLLLATSCARHVMRGRPHARQLQLRRGAGADRGGYLVAASWLEGTGVPRQGPGRPPQCTPQCPGVPPPHSMP